jgi:hypothetical protein
MNSTLGALMGVQHLDSGLGLWYFGMIFALGAGGPKFDSRIDTWAIFLALGPNIFFPSCYPDVWTGN